MTLTMISQTFETLKKTLDILYDVCFTTQDELLGLVNCFLTLLVHTIKERTVTFEEYITGPLGICV